MWHTCKQCVASTRVPDAKGGFCAHRCATDWGLWTLCQLKNKNWVFPPFCFIILLLICKYASLFTPPCPFCGLLSAFYNYPKASCIVFSGAEMGHQFEKALSLFGNKTKHGTVLAFLFFGRVEGILHENGKLSFLAGGGMSKLWDVNLPLKKRVSHLFCFSLKTPIYDLFRTCGFWGSPWGKDRRAEISLNLSRHL